MVKFGLENLMRDIQMREIENLRILDAKMEHTYIVNFCEDLGNKYGNLNEKDLVPDLLDISPLTSHQISMLLKCFGNIEKAVEQELT